MLLGSRTYRLRNQKRSTLPLFGMRNASQPIGPGIVVGIATPEGYVMHAASALASHRQIRLHRDMQFRMRPAAVAHLEDMDMGSRIVRDEGNREPAAC